MESKFCCIRSQEKKCSKIINAGFSHGYFYFRFYRVGERRGGEGWGSLFYSCSSTGGLAVVLNESI